TASRDATASVDGSITELNSFDAASLTSMFDIEPQQVNVPTMSAHAIAVEDGFATEHGLTMGSQVPVTFAEGATTLTVEAIYGDSTWVGSAFVDHSVPNSFGIDQLDAKVYVQTAKGVDGATARSILDKAAAKYPNVEVQD